MTYKLTISGKLPNLNDFIRADKINRYKGGDLKRKSEEKVMQSIYEQLGRLRISRPVYIYYHWIEQNKRRDLDNISSFGRKVIQDALVKTKVLQNDGWSNIIGFFDSFSVDKDNPRIEIEIEEKGL